MLWLLCCAVLCCAVLCCAVLCCAVLCCAVLGCAVLCCAVLCCAVLCCTVLYLVGTGTVWGIPALFDSVFGFLQGLPNGLAVLHDWHFRCFLDHFSAWMCACFVLCLYVVVVVAVVGWDDIHVRDDVYCRTQALCLE